jgi:hypothetical protein
MCRTPQCRTVAARSLLVAVVMVLFSAAAAFAQAQTRWYLPEGATGPAFEEFILLANPTATPATVRLTFLKGDGSPQTVDTTVAPTSRRTVYVNQLPGLENNGELSVVVDSLNGVPIVAERSMYWLGTDRRGGHNATGIAAPATTWYLAEGATGFFTTYVLLSNPGASAVTATLSFQREDGPIVNHVQAVPANSRRTVAVNDVPGMGPNLAFATTITATGPILVERAMYWLGFAGGHAASAIATPATTWHFAEGFTAGDFQTFVLLGNPNAAATSITARFMRDDGVVVTRNYTIPARSRLTIYTNSIPELSSAAFATSVESSLPIVAERATYWGGFQEGNAVAGEPALRQKWGFAEAMAGTVDGLPYETFFLFSNPSTSPITVTGTFYREDGTGTILPITVGAQSRVTLYGATVLGMDNQRFAAFFESSAPFLVERAVYWGANRFGGHGSAGVPWTGTIQAPPGLTGPTITPAGGTFAAEPSVQLTTAVPGTIRYTLDGSDPTAGSTPYGGPFTLTQTATLRARTFFAGGASSQISSATFTLQVATPGISPPSGTYTGGEPVTIQVPPGATVRYTTTGVTPTEASPIYSGPLAFSGQQVQLRARAFRSGWTPSVVAAADYTFTQGTLAMPVPTPAAGVVAPGQNINMSIPPGSLVHYTLDGSEPTEASPTYFGIPIVLQEPATLRARAFAPNFTPSPILIAVYQMRVATPTMTPNGGTFTASTLVQMNTATANATVRYSLDGDDPTDTSPAATSVIVPLDSILKVRAFRAGWEPSNVIDAAFAGAPGTGSSPAIVQLGGGVSGTAFQQSGGTVQFGISNGSIVPSSVQVDVNGVRVPQHLVSATGSQVSAISALQEGRNTFAVIGADPSGLLIFETATVWAGSRSLQVSVRTPAPANAAIAGASVSAELVAAPEVTAAAVTNGSGLATLSRLPVSHKIRVQVEATGYFTKVVEVAANVTSVTVVLDLDNNDFESTDARGWVVESSSYFVWPHSEARRAWVPCSTCPTRGSAQAMQAQEPSLGNALVGPDYDAFVDNRNSMAVQRLTRSYSATTGTRSVTVRYRFGSAEFFAPAPVGDTFRVTLRSSSGQQRVDNQTSLTLMPLMTDGITPWRTLTIPVAAAGEVITVEATVAHAFDMAYASYFELDSLKEVRYEASAKFYEYRTQPSISTTTNEPLNFLSVSPHNYWNGNGMTRVRGTLTLSGPADDAVSDVELLVYEVDDLEERAIGRLPQAVRPSVLRTFGASGQIVISTVQLLFEINSSDTGTFGQTTERELDLVLRVSYTSGRAPLYVTIRRVQKLVRYTGTNRYQDRDSDDCVLPAGNAWNPYPCGGDDWARASVADVADDPPLSGLVYGDFSNQNGMKFPPHRSAEHQDGTGADVVFGDTRLRANDQRMGQALVALLNSASGSRIVRILITYTASLRRFVDAAPALADGRQVRDVLVDYPEHVNHFHIQFRPVATP